METGAFAFIKKAATYSPALHCSTIGDGGLNFSVRDGKRWGPAAITTSKGGHADTQQDNSGKHAVTSESTTFTQKVVGQLVALGFDVAVFAPAPYRRSRLLRPSRSPNLAEGFALRCFQRLSLPDADTRRCA